MTTLTSTPGSPTPETLPLPYTTVPWKLFLTDLRLWSVITFTWPISSGIPSILFPILPFRSGPLDELYPTPANLFSCVVQLVLSLAQLAFLVFLIPLAFLCYTPIWLVWIVGFVGGNHWLTGVLLNGRERREFWGRRGLSGNMSEDQRSRMKGEKWVFVNGVAAGEHWLQSNLDRLSLTFGREIYGIHNQTRGVIFDLIECMLERTFSYPTTSTRMVYSHLLSIVSDPQYSRIVLLLHSQGAIEGGLALDWLFASVPVEQLSRIEVYTFGSAANHFNNPIVSTSSAQQGKQVDRGNFSGDDNASGGDGIDNSRVIRYIEHYANSGDYVSKFGVLHFRPVPGYKAKKVDMVPQEAENRYFGRLFVKQGTGHQLNGNYLDDIFTFEDNSLGRIADHNVFMDSVVQPKLAADYDMVVARETEVSHRLSGQRDGGSSSGGGKHGVKNGTDDGVDDGQKRVRDLSRLWQYRNGGVPST